MCVCVCIVCGCVCVGVCIYLLKSCTIVHIQSIHCTLGIMYSLVTVSYSIHYNIIYITLRIL